MDNSEVRFRTDGCEKDVYNRAINSCFVERNHHAIC